jgi:hypothetical protein
MKSGHTPVRRSATTTARTSGDCGASSSMELTGFLIVFALGFAVGYGVREQKSRMRRRRYTRDLSDVDSVFDPGGDSRDLKSIGQICALLQSLRSRSGTHNGSALTRTRSRAMLARVPHGTRVAVTRPSSTIPQSPLDFSNEVGVWPNCTIQPRCDFRSCPKPGSGLGTRHGFGLRSSAQTVRVMSALQRGLSLHFASYCQQSRTKVSRLRRLYSAFR